MSSSTVERRGIAFGLAVAASGSIYFTLARAGVVDGFGPMDLTLLRFSVPGLVLLPILLRYGVRDLAGIGWGRGLVLVAVGGPAFNLFQAAGFAYAPLAHGAVITPAAVTLLSTLLATVFLGERLGARRWLGTGLVITGLALLGWDALRTGGPSMLWGDLLFVAAGAVWSVFTVLLRHWRVDPVRATAVTSCLSLLGLLAVYQWQFGLASMAQFETSALLLQLFGQGLLAGLVLVFAYTQAVTLLGPSRGALFPSMVPGLATLLGIPVLGEMPTLTQLAGLAVATFGLLLAIGLIRLPASGKT